MGALLTYRYRCYDADAQDLHPIVAGWCNDGSTTEYMAAGRGHMTAEQAKHDWSGRAAFMAFAGEEWWQLDTPVGVVGLYNHDPLSEKAELKILLGKMRGCGLGTRMIRDILRYAFVGMGLWRVYLGTAAENEAALRCFHRCGFKDEGLLVDDLKRNGKRYTNVRMAIMREEWDALQQG